MSRSGTSAEPFTAEHFEWWSRRLILDSGEPWGLEEFQLVFVADLFEGARECWLVLPEGNGKTTFVAGLGLYGLRFAEDALIPVAASSRDQARIMYRQAKGFLRRSRLDDPGFSFEAFDGYRRVDLRVPGRTKRGEVAGSIEIHAADAGTGDGIIPFPFAFLDELHRHRSLDLYETWRGKLDKRGAQLIAISTAGEPGGEFEQARKAMRQQTPVVELGRGRTRCVSGEVVFHEYALEEGGDPEDMEAVKRCNPLRKITVESLAEKWSSPTVSPQHWSRFVCNLATRSGLAAITEAEWFAARTEARIPEGEPVWLGLDLGWKYDTTAMVPLWVRDPEFRLLGPATVLEPPRNGDQLDAHLVEDALLAVHDANPVHTVVMDITNAAQLSQWIEETLGSRVVDRSQANSLATLDYARFMEALRMGWLRHCGDPGLTQHALNAVARVLPQGDIKFERPRESRTVRDELARRRVIDALVAAAMVHTTAAAELDGTARSGWRPL